MNRRPEIHWTCPDCRTQNVTAGAPGAEDGRIVEVRCAACGRRHEASVFLARGQAGAARTVGIVWI